LAQIGAYLKEHRPAFAYPTVSRLYQAAESLIQFPYRGRVGQEAGTRELVVPRLPYVIVYQVAGDVVSIARILHGAQDWPAR
jgi:plasmid stabilization system protein ParE